MKKEWNAEELRRTSEEIRDAIMPKSVTPDMVGGTLLALTNAVGEVVETLGEIPTCHVKVQVYTSDNYHRGVGSGAVVYVDTFTVGGIPTQSYPQRELIANADGIVEFDVLIGCKFAVKSKLDGFGASFQFVYEATYEPREIDLWHLPVGVGWCMHLDRYNDDTEESIDMPMLLPKYVSSYDEDESMEQYLEEGWYFDDCVFSGIIVSTADATFIIPEDNLSGETMTWCKVKDYKNEFITLPGVWYDYEKGEEYSDAQNRARNDFGGNLNTSKILAHASDAPAAEWCSNIDPWGQYYLPSSGELYLMYLNRDAINAIMKAANADGYSYKLLPYQLNGKWQNPNGSYEYWWSSTRSTIGCSWVVYYGGYIDNGCRTDYGHVRAVSAFHFEY